MNKPEIYKKDHKYNIIFSDQDGKDNEFEFIPDEDMSKPKMIMKCKEANKNFVKLKEIKKLEEGVHKMEENQNINTLADLIKSRDGEGLDIGDNTIDMIVYFEYDEESDDSFDKCLKTIAEGTKVINVQGDYAIVDFYNYVIDHLNAFTNNFTINIDPADGEDNETIAANIVEGILPGLISGYTNDHTYNSLDTDLLMGVQKKEESFEDSKKFMAGEILAIIDNYINSEDILNLFNRMGITQEIYEGDEEIPEGKIQDIIEIGLQWLFDHLRDEDYRRILKDELEMTDAEMEKYGVELDESKEVKTESKEDTKYKEKNLTETKYGDSNPDKIVPDAYCDIEKTDNGYYINCGIGTHTSLGGGNFIIYPEDYLSNLHKEVKKLAKERGIKRVYDKVKTMIPEYNAMIPEYNANIEDMIKNLTPFAEKSKQGQLTRADLDGIEEITGKITPNKMSTLPEFEWSGKFGRLRSLIGNLERYKTDLSNPLARADTITITESKEVKTESGNYGGLTKEEIEAELEKYENQGFDVHQISQIQYGLEAGLDVSKYADPKLGFLQMQEIRLGLLRGVDVSEYVMSGQFDTYQLDEIIYGLAAGVDVSKYANPEFNEDKMQEIRKGLENGVDVSKYANPKYTWGQMEQIRVGLEKGIDVSKYADPKYTWGQMSAVRYGLEQGVDMFKYLDLGFKGPEMLQIQYGLENGVDVSKYDDPKYNAGQMEQIRVGLEAGLDISKYADPKLKSYQMRIIREGLKDGVDITPYMDYKSTVKDLESIKYALTQGFIPKKAKNNLK